MARNNRYLSDEQQSDFLRQRGSALEADLIALESRIPELEDQVRSQVAQIEQQAEAQKSQLLDQLDAEKSRKARIDSALSEIDSALGGVTPATSTE